MKIKSSITVSTCGGVRAGCAIIWAIFTKGYRRRICIDVTWVASAYIWDSCWWWWAVTVYIRQSNFVFITWLAATHSTRHLGITPRASQTRSCSTSITSSTRRSKARCTLRRRSSRIIATITSCNTLPIWLMQMISRKTFSTSSCCRTFLTITRALLTKYHISTPISI